MAGGMAERTQRHVSVLLIYDAESLLATVVAALISGCTPSGHGSDLPYLSHATSMYSF
jgi:hypothetical protein